MRYLLDGVLPISDMAFFAASYASNISSFGVTLSFNAANNLAGSSKPVNVPLSVGTSLIVSFILVSYSLKGWVSTFVIISICFFASLTFSIRLARASRSAVYSSLESFEYKLLISFIDCQVLLEFFCFSAIRALVSSIPYFEIVLLSHLGKMNIQVEPRTLQHN